jgi:hypothetical protein
VARPKKKDQTPAVKVPMPSRMKIQPADQYKYSQPTNASKQGSG